MIVAGEPVVLPIINESGIAFYGIDRGTVFEPHRVVGTKKIVFPRIDPAVAELGESGAPAVLRYIVRDVAVCIRIGKDERIAGLAPRRTGGWCNGDAVGASFDRGD